MGALRAAMLAAILSVVSFGQSITLPGLTNPNVSTSWLYYNKMRWAGAWSSASTYNPQDVATLNGHTYVSLSGSNLNHSPAPGGTAWWSELPTNAGLPATSSQLQYLRTKPNAGNNTTLEFAQQRAPHYSTDYNFDPQSPVESLVQGGVGQSITMAPCPLGVNGANTGHALRILDASAENLTIAGGTCTAGAASGTLILSAPAHNHTGVGGYTVFSASAGGTEAVYAAGSGGRVHFPAGNYTLYGEMYVPTAFTAFTISGDGVGVTVLTQASTTANLIHAGPAAGYINIQSLSLYGQDAATGGTLLKLDAASAGVVRDLYLYSGYKHIYIGSPNTLQVSNIRGSYAHSTALELEAVVVGPNMAGDFSNVNMGSVTTAPGLLIHTQNTRSVVGLTFTGGSFASAGKAVQITDDGNATTAIHEITFTGVTMTGTVYGLWVDPTAGAGVSVLKVTGGTYLASQGSGGTGGVAVYLGKRVSGATFTDTFMEAADTQPMVVLAGAKDVGFYNCRGYNGSGAGSSYAVQITAYGDGTVCDRIHLANNRFGVSPYGGGGFGIAGLAVSAAAHTNLLIENNYFGGSVAAVAYAGTGTGNIFRGNHLDPASGAPGKMNCTAGIRGSDWYTPGASGVLDLMEVCVKTGPDAYAWTQEIRATIGAVVHSANTITTVTDYVHHVDGTSTIKTLNAPAGCTAVCTVTLIADAAWGWDNSDNILKPAATAAVGAGYVFTYDATAAKWY